MKSKNLAFILSPGFLTFAASTATICGATYDWNAAAGGNWNNTTTTGWNTGGGANFPDGFDDIAYINRNIGADSTISINVANARVGTLFLSDNQTNVSHHWIVASSNGTNALTFQRSTGSALLDIGRSLGVTAVNAPIKLNSNLQIKVQSTSGGLDIGGVISDGTSSSGIEKIDSDLLILSAANTYSGNTVQTAGTLRTGVTNAIPARFRPALAPSPTPLRNPFQQAAEAFNPTNPTIFENLLESNQS